MISEKLLELMNEAFEADPHAVHSLVCNRVPCNKTLQDHPYIQVDMLGYETDRPFATVGFLGLLNGLCAQDGNFLCLEWSEGDTPQTSRPIGFKLINEAEVYGQAE